MNSTVTTIVQALAAVAFAAAACLCAAQPEAAQDIVKMPRVIVVGKAVQQLPRVVVTGKREGNALVAQAGKREQI